MEMQLNSLIEKIKQEGVLESRRISEEIIQQAEERKKAIIQEAQENAEFIVKDAKAQADKLRDNSQKAITQAVRDAALSLKQEAKNLFDAILKKEVQNTLSDGFTQELILKIIGSWLKEKKAGLEISVSQQDKERLEKLLLSKLKDESVSGITLKPNPNINKGIYIGWKGEDFHYDFTDEAISGILKEYLRPFIVKIIDEEGSK